MNLDSEVRAKDVIRKNPARLAAPVLLCLLAAAACAGPASAVEPKRKMPVKQIETAILAYARSIGCNEAFDRRNIVAVPQDYGVDSNFQYLVVYWLDVGCSGGSAMGRSLFAVLKPGGQSGYVVDPELSRPEATTGFPRVIDRVSVRRGRIVYAARDFDFTKDALCCPSVAVTGELSLRKKTVDVGKSGATVHFWVDDHRQ